MLLAGDRSYKGASHMQVPGPGDRIPTLYNHVTIMQLNVK